MTRPDFANYFVNNYGAGVESWAYCHRIHAGINTNIHIERMHRTLKHIYLEGKKVKRLDKSLYALLKFLRDKSIDRLIVLHKGKITSKIKELRKRHKNSLKMSINNALKDGEGYWNVMASGLNDMYTVNKLKDSCDCQIICDECKTCIHCFSCTCSDSAIKWNFCKHIHLVCLSEKVQNINTNTYTKNLMEEKKNETVSIVCQLNNTEVIQEVDNLVHEKQKLKNIFDTMLNTVSSLDELDVLKKCSSSAQPTLLTLGNNYYKKPFKKIKKLFISVVFFSTKNTKKHTKASTILVPSNIEKNNISASLLLMNKHDNFVSLRVWKIACSLIFPYHWALRLANKMLDIIGRQLKKLDTVLWLSIPPEERPTVTLR
ncbi:hypothetical protein AGLY_011585 [Aphis glycines]|uniref:SWIM-type domain-containing protein n=1 Tax=Aphis glycines TaxID=307491 RepID=A0A6G0TCJ2_APHGL|nr:hypothetical protein AGLY_011585 [Aphis glycines]